MTTKQTIEYPALVYKNRKNNAYIANCIMFNLIGLGKTESDAISHLQKSMSDVLDNYHIIIKPVKKMALTC